MYLFVDAGYLREVMKSRLSKFLGVQVDTRWGGMRQHFGADRVFVYDCIDDVEREDEEPAAFASRVAAQEAELEKIAALDGYFVRRGSLRGTKKRRRQKEVDVLLAVDMLSHSHRRNVDRMTLVAGDLDFRPLVEALVDQGTIVTVVCDARGSKDLAHAADSRRLLTLQELWKLSNASQVSGGPEAFPSAIDRKPDAIRVVNGFAYGGGVAGQLFRAAGQSWWIDIDALNLFKPSPRCFCHPDRERLLSFLVEEFGPIEWDGDVIDPGAGTSLGAQVVANVGAAAGQQGGT